MKKVKLLLLFLFIMIIPSIRSNASQTERSYDYEGYYYNFWGRAVASPAAYTITDEINGSHLNGMKLESMEDVTVSHDNRIFLVDKLESRVHVFDNDFHLLQSIKLIRNGEGKIVIDDKGNQVMLTNPEGAFYHNKNDELYIADTGAKRVLVLDGSTLTLKRLIETPSNMSGVTDFKPSKIAVDKADRIYIVVQSSYEGIIELNADGSFSRYFGVNVPKVNLIDFFWKSLASDTQKQKMGKTYAPAFSNITMDAEGFVHAVTYDTAAQQMVFRLNSKGENVLREEGSLYVVGDVNYMQNPSKFVDIAVSDYGVYAVLDMTRGRVFIYDFDGQLITVFGGLGNHKGQLKSPTSIEFIGYDLIITDTELKCAYRLTPTKFGNAALKANEKYYYGKWDEATALYEEALTYNSNYEVAYTGIGKNYLMKDDYEQAMYYFKMGNAREYYSKAYNGYRGEMIKDNFYIFVILFVLFMGGLIYSEYKYHKKGGKTK